MTTTTTPRKRKGSDDDEHAGNMFIKKIPGRQIQKNIESDDSTKLSGLYKQEPIYCLPYYQATMFACAIEDCLAQVRILAECNNQLRLLKTMADIGILRAKKYQIKTVENREDLTRINTKDLGSMQYKLDKLVADRLYFQEVLEETYQELAQYRCFSVLISCNKEVEEREVYRMWLTEEEAKNKVSRRELMKQLRLQRIHIKTVAYDTDVVIEQLKSKIEDAALNSEIRERYVTNWQCARTEQHTQRIEDTESGPSTAIAYFRNRSDQEQRVHAEIDLLVNIFINETLTQVENWMNKYDTDMEAIDLKITIMKNKYQDEVARRKGMEEDLAHHDVQMTQWNDFKDAREKARLYRKKMTESAIIVQAWWRGLLVRLEMGPYRPKKKPGFRPDKGKKK
ncbi:dynein regulatory complex protein 9 isoform X1 [Spodoptera frugiperda]|uniref:Dynein regulatory complex protein 9 n=1 Tax=Spodoptera frugiperda TaxID=7108 RepID=A0A9R0EPZ1_SPOFR|nr:dynein regulatory complex protein 9 isoform X1 [Spodoptera frugiperda]